MDELGTDEREAVSSELMRRTTELKYRLRELRLMVMATERDVAKNRFKIGRSHLSDAFDLQLGRVRELLDKKVESQRIAEMFSSKKG